MGYIKKLDSRYGTTHKVANWEIVRWYVEPFIERVKVEVGTFDTADTQIGRYEPLEVTTYTFKMSQFGECINKASIEDILSTLPEFKESVRIEPHEVVIFGCTDPNACNYNSEATHNDESCVYPPGYKEEEEMDDRFAPINCEDVSLEEAQTLLEADKLLQKTYLDQLGGGSPKSDGEEIVDSGKIKLLQTRIRSLEICIKLKIEAGDTDQNEENHS